jgi:CBS domain containing-hemolysin-like protein
MHCRGALPTRRTPSPHVQDALETMVVRVIEEKVEQIVSAALSPPDISLFQDTAEQIQVLDLYLSMLQPMNTILKEFCAAVAAELPSKAAAQSSLEGLLTVLQACPPLATVSSTYTHTAVCTIVPVDGGRARTRRRKSRCGLLQW